MMYRSIESLEEGFSNLPVTPVTAVARVIVGSIKNMKLKRGITISSFEFAHDTFYVRYQVPTIWGKAIFVMNVDMGSPFETMVGMTGSAGNMSNGVNINTNKPVRCEEGYISDKYMTKISNEYVDTLKATLLLASV